MYGKKVDKSEIRQSGGQSSGARFGVNAFVMDDISLVADDENSSSLYIQIEGHVGERQFRHREYEVNKAYDGNTEITDQDHPAFQKAVDMFNSYMNDLAIAYVGEEQFYSKLTAQQFSGFSDYANFIINIIKNSSSFKNENPILIFLQFQWSPRGTETRTYLDFPKSSSIKHGDFFAYCPEDYNTRFRKFTTDKDGKIFVSKKVGNEYLPVEVGQWEETDDPKTVKASIQVDDDTYDISYTSSTSKVSYENGRIGLFFLNEDGQMPPLTRTKWFAESNFSVPQDISQQASSISSEIDDIDEADLPFED